MARKYILAGASVGLSALLAAMLLSAPQPTPKPKQQVLKPIAASENTATVKVLPKVVLLPAPPQPRPPKPPMTVLKPNVSEKPAPAIVRPLQPSPAKPMEQKQQPLEPVVTSAKEVATAAPVALSKTDTAQGRVLLRLLEHGRGPAIELAWPQNAGARARLYHRFRECFGMQVALRDRSGGLFVADSLVGQNWQPNSDRYSGFARQPSGRLVPAERDDLYAIARRHGISSHSPAMRIFPRHVDARLLGGLQKILAGDYKGARAIRARYYLSNGAIQVRDIQVDGRSVAGSILLGSRCRRS